eukprot:SAG31_NODE_5016_length_2799_cov_58.320000_2_plen_151_part_00
MIRRWCWSYSIHKHKNLCLASPIKRQGGYRLLRPQRQISDPYGSLRSTIDHTIKYNTTLEYTFGYTLKSFCILYATLTLILQQPPWPACPPARLPLPPLLFAPQLHRHCSLRVAATSGAAASRAPPLPSPSPAPAPALPFSWQAARGAPS